MPKPKFIQPLTVEEQRMLMSLQAGEDALKRMLSEQQNTLRAAKNNIKEKYAKALEDVRTDFFDFTDDYEFIYRTLE